MSPCHPRTSAVDRGRDQLSALLGSASRKRQLRCGELMRLYTARHAPHTDPRPPPDRVGFHLPLVEATIATSRPTGLRWDHRLSELASSTTTVIPWGSYSCGRVFFQSPNAPIFVCLFSDDRPPRIPPGGFLFLGGSLWRFIPATHRTVRRTRTLSLSLSFFTFDPIVMPPLLGGGGAREPTAFHQGGHRDPTERRCLRDVLVAFRTVQRDRDGEFG